MAVPKKKKSRSRRDKRRSHDALVAPGGIHTCPSCGERKLYHHVCPSCGQYKGRAVLPAAAAE